MTEIEIKELKEKIKKEGRVSDIFIRELAQLIKLAGYDIQKDIELQKFSWLGGGASHGISNTKIKWILDFGMIPKIDFLYALANIAFKIKGTNYYKKIKVKNPIKYEYERYLSICNYTFKLGNIWPPEIKYQIRKDLKTESYLASIPNIFWDLTLKFEDIVAHFHKKIKYSEQLITLDNYTSITFGLYNYEQNSNWKKIEPVDIEGDYCPTPDIFRFKIDNTNEQLHFKSIEVIRCQNTAYMLSELINGHWIEMTNSGYYEWDVWQKLNIDNFYNSKDFSSPDIFFAQLSENAKKSSEWKDIFTIEKLYSKLTSNNNYNEAYKQLSLVRKKEIIDY